MTGTTVMTQLVRGSGSGTIYKGRQECTLRTLFPKSNLASRFISSRLRVRQSIEMPATRSSARLASQAQPPINLASDETVVGEKPTRKRKTASEDPLKTQPTKKPARKQKATNHDEIPQREFVDEDEKTKLVPAVLSFDFATAKKHLVEVDHRFGELFKKMPCKPYEVLEQVHPFRYLKAFYYRDHKLTLNLNCSALTVSIMWVK